MAGTRRIAGLAAVVLALSACATLTEVSAPTAQSPAGRIYEQGNAGPTVSGDGRYSVYDGPRSAQDSTSEVFRHDNQAGTTVRVSSDASGAPVGGDAAAISRDGRYVVFRTTAPLVAADTNRDPAYGWTGTDYYVRDMDAPASYELVSLDPAGEPIISGGPNGLNQYVYVSATGRYVAFQFEYFEGRTFDSDIYVRDRQAGTTTLVDGGYAALAGLSGDGLHVAVDDSTPCIVLCPEYAGGHVTDWKAGTTVTIGCEAGGTMPMSDDGRYVATWQTGHLAGCVAGVARYDRQSLASQVMATPTVPENSYGRAKIAISGDGSRVLYDDTAAIDPGDTNGFADVYLTDLSTADRFLVSRSQLNALGDGNSYADGLSADGVYAQFATTATNLLDQDTDGATDLVLTPAVRPVVTGVQPGQLARGSSDGPVYVVGSGFGPGDSVSFGAGITVSDVVPIGPHAIAVTVTVAPNAVPGSRTVEVRAVGASGVAAGYCFGCVTVT